MLLSLFACLCLLLHSPLCSGSPAAAAPAPGGSAPRAAAADADGHPLASTPFGAAFLAPLGCRALGGARIWSGGEACFLPPPSALPAECAGLDADALLRRKPLDAAPTPPPLLRALQAAPADADPARCHAVHRICPLTPLRIAVRGGATVRVIGDDAAAAHVAISAIARDDAASVVAATAAAAAVITYADDKHGALVSLPLSARDWELLVSAVTPPHAAVGKAAEAAADAREAFGGDFSRCLHVVLAYESGPPAPLRETPLLEEAEEEEEQGEEEEEDASTPPLRDTPLQDGVPTPGFVSSLVYSYYSFYQPAPLQQQVDISLISIAGNADLFVTLSGSSPTIISNSYRSENAAADSVLIRPGDGPVSAYCGGTAVGICAIRIGVLGVTPASFLVTATTAAGATRLTDGVPLVDNVATAGGTAYYAFSATAAAARIAIAVTAIAGLPDLYVSNSVFVAGGGGSTRPSASAPGSYCALSALADGRDVVELYAGDACFCAGCTFYIGVAAAGAPASFSIVATESAVPTILLLDGLPQAGFLPEDESAQFLFNLQLVSVPGLPAARRVLQLLLQSYFGDCDLYVSLQPDVRPSPAAYDYASERDGGSIDTITVRATDAAFARSAPCVFALAHNGSCAVRIAAYGFTAAAFAVLATSGRFVQLFDAQPQADVVDARALAYFRFSTLAGDAASLVTIAVAPRSGDPDIYCGSDADPATTVPTTAPGTYIWSASTLGVDTVQIDPRDPGACAPPCSYYCAVYGYGANASFTITAATGSAVPTRLLPGEPADGIAAAGTYTRYTADFNNSALMLTLLPTAGDPDMYARLDNVLVTDDNAQYASATLGVETISIQPTDAAYRANCGGGGGGPCQAHIGVLAYGDAAAAFTLTASLPGGVVSLADGRPAAGALPRDGVAYFVFNAQSRVPITISLSSLAGDADLYLSTRSRTPNASGFMWQSSAASGPEVVLLSFDDPLLAPCATPCAIWLGVAAFGGPARFTVVASSATAASLLPGLPSTGAAGAWAFSYYKLSLPTAPSWAPEPVEFAVTPLGGGGAGVALYVNAVPFNYSGGEAAALPALSCAPPSCPGWTVRNARWSSFGSPSRERVLITPGAPGYLVGTYLVGVLALGAPAPFVLTGYLAGGITTLQDGIPFPDEVAARAYNYYRLILGAWGADVSITVTPSDGGDADLFVSVHAAVRRPNASAYDAASREPRGPDVVYIPWRALAECQAQIDPAGAGGSCDIWIAVQGFTAAAYSVVALAVDGGARTTLVDGVPQGGRVPLHSYAYYVAHVALPTDQAFSLYVRSLTGDADVYLRTDGLTPSASFYQLASTRASGDEIINIVPGSPYYRRNCTLVVAVYGYSNATFAVTYASSTAVVELDNAVAQGGILPGDGGLSYQYFYVAARDPSADVLLVLTALAGDADFYVSPWTSPSFRPTAGTAAWSGTAFGSDSVYIAASDARACGACNYIVAVNCADASGACAFVLVAVISPSSVVALADGQPVASAAQAQRYRYFSFSTGGVAANVTFAAVDLTGDVELYVAANASAAAALPSAAPGGWTWSTALGGNTTGSGVVTVAADDPRALPPAPFTVAAFCVSGPCAFGVLALSDGGGGGGVPQVLVPGEPSPERVLPAGASATFVLSVLDTTRDLVLVATALDGTVVVALAPPTRPAPACAAGTPGICRATWVGAPSELRVAAAAPCGPPYTAGACVPAADWRAGQFAVTVFAVGAAATFSVTAFASTAAVRLVDGTPQDGEATSAAPPFFQYQTSADGVALPDIRISVTSGDAGMPLVVFVTSCFDSACTPAATAPGPTNYAAAATVPAGDTADLFLSRYSPAYCAGGAGGGGGGGAAGTCNYFVSVSPGLPCAGTCVAPLSIVAQRQGGSLTRVPFFSRANTSLTQPGTVAAGRAAVFELYLPPAPPAAAITARLDACGPARPSLYLCAPSAGAAPRRCANPFAPSAADNGGAASTAAGAGTVVLAAPAVTAANLFFAVANAAAAAAGAAGAAAAYSLTFAAGGAPTPWRGDAAPSASASADARSATVNVSWPAARIGAPGSPAGSRAARGVVYSLFAAPGGFAAAAPPGAAALPTTACGLIRWAALAAATAEPPLVVFDATAASLSLQPGVFYEFGVMAECDSTCWRLNAAAGEVEAAAAAAAAAAAGGLGAGAPGYAIQRVAFATCAATAGGAPYVPPAAPFPVSGIVGISVAALALASGGVALWRYRRRRAADGSSQYASLDVSGAVDTIAVPSSAGGIFGSLKRALGGGGRAAADGSVNSAPLSSSSYSELDDRTAGYL